MVTGEMTNLSGNAARLYEALPVPTLLVEPHSLRITAGNRAARDLLGLDPRTLGNLRYSDLVADAGATSPEPGRVRLRDRDGSLIDADLAVTTEAFADANVTIICALGAQPADHGRKAEPLGDDDPYRRIVEAAGEGIVLLDDHGRIRVVNPRMARMLDRAADELIGQRFAVVVAADAHHELDARLAERSRRDDTLDVALVRRNGSQLEVSLATTPLFDRDGRSAGSLLLASDLTDRRRAETDRAELAGKLAQAHKMEAIGRLAGNLAHDVNNSLTVIMSGADILCSELPADHALRLDAEELAQAARRSADLTRQLLSFSRRHQVQLEAVDLNQLIEQLTPSLEELLGDRIRLIVDLATDLPPILADRGQLERILFNLADNARDAMPDGGNFGLETRSLRLIDAGLAQRTGSLLASDVLLRVRDTGRGMDPDTRAQVFEPFFTTKAGAAGLGLTMVYGALRQFGATIEVTSTLGRGSQFDLRLPLSTAPATKQPPVVVAGATLMLVEDEAPVRRAAARLLEEAGYRVIEAESGEEALRLFGRSGPIDLVITDVVMPGMNGRILAEHLLERRADQQILFVSGYHDDAVLARGIHDQGLEFLAKPYTIGDLVSRVVAMIGAPTRTVA
jgi:two-component system cell cycle sensor histidine kinase/response regulator CckA